MPAHTKTIDEIYKNLNTNENGLSLEEASKRLNKYGKNVLDEGEKSSQGGDVLSV